MTATCRQSLGHVRLVHSHRDVPPCCRPSHQSTPLLCFVARIVLKALAFKNRVSHKSPPLLFCGADGVESPRFQDRVTNLRHCCFVAWIVWKVLAFKNRVSHKSTPLLFCGADGVESVPARKFLERGAGKTLLSKRFAPQANAQIKQNS